MPLEIVLVIRDRLEGRRALAAGETRVEGVEAREMIDRADLSDRQDLRRQALERLLLIVGEDVIGQPVGLVERRAIDGP